MQLTVFTILKIMVRTNDGKDNSEGAVSKNVHLTNLYSLKLQVEHWKLTKHDRKIRTHIAVFRFWSPLHWYRPFLLKTLWNNVLTNAADFDVFRVNKSQPPSGIKVGVNRYSTIAKNHFSRQLNHHIFAVSTIAMEYNYAWLSSDGILYPDCRKSRRTNENIQNGADTQKVFDAYEHQSHLGWSTYSQYPKQQFWTCEMKSMNLVEMHIREK